MQREVSILRFLILWRSVALTIGACAWRQVHLSPGKQIHGALVSIICTLRLLVFLFLQIDYELYV